MLLDFRDRGDHGAHGSVRCAQRATASAVFFVKDDGVGFDMRYAETRSAPSSGCIAPTEFEGTGIGLATVQRIVHRHLGRVWAESVVGKGTTFYFTLPSADVATDGDNW